MHGRMGTLTLRGDDSHSGIQKQADTLDSGMNSKLVEAIGLKTLAVALTWADAAPQGAFKPAMGVRRREVTEINGF